MASRILAFPARLKNLVMAVNTLRSEGRVLAYHDRSDGGLWAWEQAGFEIEAASRA